MHHLRATVAFHAPERPHGSLMWHRTMKGRMANRRVHLLWLGPVFVTWIGK